MEEKRESQERKPFVEPELTKIGKLDEVTFQPGAGYSASSAATADPPSGWPFSHP